MIETYERNMDDFYLYKVYCANQSNSLRTLKSLDKLQEFTDYIAVKLSYKVLRAVKKSLYLIS